MPRARDKSRTRPWDAAATELIDEIVSTAERIAGARSSSGERVFPDDAESVLLRTVAESSYCLTIADVARALRISRQATHKLVHGAMVAGRVEHQCLLVGLADHRMVTVTHTRRVIRQRLERDERERRRVEHEERERQRLSRDRFFR